MAAAAPASTQHQKERWVCVSCAKANAMPAPDANEKQRAAALHCRECAAPHPTARLSAAVIAAYIANARAEAAKNPLTPQQLSETGPLVCQTIGKRASGDPTPQRRVRIVCVSDTHTRHHSYTSSIPYGDILIHSGDFCNKLTPDNYASSLEDFNYWFTLLPHPNKIFVAGNHEVYLPHLSVKEISQRLPAVTYLQDSGVIIHGIAIYGSPWNSSSGGYGARSEQRNEKWKAIPASTNLLVTHTPPFNILDLAWVKHKTPAGACATCGDEHRSFEHWGDDGLRQHVLKRLAPAPAAAADAKQSAATAAAAPAGGGSLRVHQFGHVHDDFGAKTEGGVLFINAAMDIKRRPVAFDWWVDETIAAAAAAVPAPAAAAATAASLPAPKPVASSATATGGGGAAKPNDSCALA